MPSAKACVARLLPWPRLSTHESFCSFTYSESAARVGWRMRISSTSKSSEPLMLALPAVGITVSVGGGPGRSESSAVSGATIETVSGMSMSYESCCGMVMLSVWSSTRHSDGAKYPDVSSAERTMAFQPIFWSPQLPSKSPPRVHA